MRGLLSVPPRFDPLDPAGIDDLLTADELAVRESVRQLCSERISIPTSLTGSSAARSPTFAV